VKRLLLLLVLTLLGCGGTTRFALRPPVTRLADDRPLARAPAFEEGSDAADVMVLRPLAHAFLFDVTGESHDVNALDEVPDSTWYRNRTVTPSDLVRGPCPDDGPVPPFTIESTKGGGATSGFVGRDSRGQKYVLKLDGGAQYGQPEINTAADAVVSRLYWAIGFNAPCNDVVVVRPSDLVLGPRAKEYDGVGRKKPMGPARFAEIVKGSSPQGEPVRLLASRFIDGKGIGTWRPEGVRPDDPNDVIRHEDRRELRSELFLAGWIAHWDSRRGNTYDTFMPSPGGGHVVHYFLDFSDSLGATIGRTHWPEPRSTFESVLSLEIIATDAVTFGAVRRPWDEVKVDERYPNLGFLDVEHFQPMSFAPQTPVVRWAHAQPADLAWMARKIARLDVAHVRVAVHAARFTNPVEETRLVEILMGRRERILRYSFARVSPLADVALRGESFCATDLARETGLATSASTSYAAEFRAGEALSLARVAPRLVRTDAGVCARMPEHFAPAGAAPDSASRYARLDLMRFEGGSKTRLRAYFYDLGDRWALVGLDRD